MKKEYFDAAVFASLNSLSSDFVHFKKKEIHLLPIGEQKFAWLVISGWMLTLRGDVNGHFKGVHFLGPQDMLGIIGFSGKSRQLPVYALSDMIVKRIPMKDLNKLLDSDIKVCQQLLGYLSRRYVETLDELEQSALMPLGERVEAFQSRMEHLSLDNPFDMSETIVGWAVGAHPVSVSRVLKDKNSADMKSFKYRSHKRLVVCSKRADVAEQSKSEKGEDAI